AEERGGGGEDGAPGARGVLKKKKPAPQLNAATTLLPRAGANPPLEWHRGGTVRPHRRACELIGRDAVRRHVRHARSGDEAPRQSCPSGGIAKCRWRSRCMRCGQR